MNRSLFSVPRAQTRASLSALILAFSLAACGQSEDATQTACESPRPEMCAQVYEPVCATTRSGDKRTYPSSCHACMDDKVESQAPGKCQ